jgi:ABC-type branched-subunit amino acid transport system substrate-binding protein
VALLAAASLILPLAGCGARVAPYLGATQVGPGATTATGGAVTPGAAAGGLGATATGAGNCLPARGSTKTTTKTTKSTVTRAAATSTTTPCSASPTGGSNGTVVAFGPTGTVPGTAGHGATSGSPRPGATSQAPASLGPATFNLNPQAEAAYCTGSTGNTGSAPGVTPTSITVGNVSGLTGVVSDSFTQGSQAVIAALDAVNRFGGICGRQIRVQVQDDQQSSSANAADVQYLIPKVLAFVGSLSDADNGGVPAMVGAGVPDGGPAINTNRSNSPVYWSATGGSVTVKNGRAYLYNTWINGLKANHDLPSSMAILSYGIPISAQAGQEYAQVFQRAGVKICYSNYNISPAPGATMGTVVTDMQSANCGGVFTTMDVVGNADMLQDMANDSYHPQLVSTTYEGYTPDQISLAGQSNAQGLQVGLSSLPLSDSNSAVQLYQSELATYEPGQPPSEFGLEAWADAQLFIYALIRSGHNPTRASVISAMSAVTNWTTEGAFGPYTPHDRTGPLCTDTVQVKGNGFSRLWPSSGLYCNGQLIDAGPAS